MQDQDANTLFEQAIAYDLGGALDRALEAYDRVLAAAPDHADAISNRANLLADLGRSEEALAGYDRAITIAPGHADAWSNRGNLLLGLGRQEEALASYDRAIALAPDHADAHCNRANLLNALQRPAEALASHDRRVELRPGSVDGWINRGTALAVLRRFEEALASFDQALRIAPGNEQAHYNRGNALNDLRRLPEALASFDRALALAPDRADAWNNRGVVLRDLLRPEQAIESFDRALAIRPDYLDARYNRANALADLKRPDAALADFDAVLAARADDVKTLNNRGNLLIHQRRTEEAVDSYARAFAIAPDHPNLLGMYLHGRMHLCSWSGHDALIDRLGEAIRAGKPAAMPFPVLALTDSLDLQRLCAETFVAQNSMPDPAAPTRRHTRHQRIRIGYFSADFHSHATMHLMAEMFERHDRRQFQLFAFSFGPDSDDEWRRRVRPCFDRFIDVRGKTDREIAAMARKLEIDIAVDLKGFTEDSNIGIFRARAAPIQVSYLGYPGTMGMAEMDYILADPVVIPESSRNGYAEALALVSGCYQANCATRRVSERPLSRTALGLPETGFVFCSFNNNYKITPTTFDSWMRILGAVEGSLLWLLVTNDTARANLRREAQVRGVDPDRLIFARGLPVEDHLARLRYADLFLDTYPYTAHTTASDALRMGLPLVTRTGPSFASRVAASLLTAAGLGELACETIEDYEALAIALARDPARLTDLRERLATDAARAGLFDARAFTRDVETLYRSMYARWRDGLPPEDMRAS